MPPSPGATSQCFGVTLAGERLEYVRSLDALVNDHRDDGPDQRGEAPTSAEDNRMRESFSILRMSGFGLQLEAQDGRAEAALRPAATPGRRGVL
jgi:hypothetical protein